MSEDIKIVASIGADTSDAGKKIDGLKKGINDTGDALGKTAKESKKSEGAFSSLGNIIKGLGIVSVISGLFNIFKEALGKNQKVADTVAAVMTTISNVMGALVGIISDVIDRVGKSSNGFDALGKVMGGLLTLAITPLKLAFYAIKLTLQEVQLAWEDSFLGDENPEKIARLTKSIGETSSALKESAVDAVGAGKAIVNNIGEAAKSVVGVVSGVIDGASKISIKGIYDQAKATVALKNTAIIASAQLKGLVEEYDRQAEQQRQIRDDESKSIDERTAANNKLKVILKDQQKAMIDLSNINIAAAQNELAANSTSLELKKGVIDAINEQKGIQAQITGLESEQKVNAIALAREKLDMNKATAESDLKIMLDNKKANAELIVDELLKAQTIQAIRDEENVKELARLQANINATTNGTQARVDAEIAFNTKKSELDNATAASDLAIAAIKLKREQDLTAAKVENEMTFFNLKKGLIDQERISAFAKAEKLIAIARMESAAQIQAINDKRDAEVAAAEKAGLDTTAIKDKYRLQVEGINNALTKSEQDLSKAKISATLEAADAVAASLNTVAQLLGESTTAGKAAAVAGATISTFSSAVKAYESTIAIPFVGPVLAPINAGLAIVAGFANIKKILAVKVPGAGSSGSMPSAPSIPTAPVLPTQTSTSLDAASINGIGNAAQGGTARSYILDSDYVSSNERNSRLSRAARIG